MVSDFSYSALPGAELSFQSALRFAVVSDNESATGAVQVTGFNPL